MLVIDIEHGHNIFILFWIIYHLYIGISHLMFVVIMLVTDLNSGCGICYLHIWVSYLSLEKHIWVVIPFISKRFLFVLITTQTKEKNKKGKKLVLLNRLCSQKWVEEESYQYTWNILCSTRISGKRASAASQTQLVLALQITSTIFC